MARVFDSTNAQDSCSFKSTCLVDLVHLPSLCIEQGKRLIS